MSIQNVRVTATEFARPKVTIWRPKPASASFSMGPPSPTVGLARQTVITYPSTRNDAEIWLSGHGSLEQGASTLVVTTAIS